MSLDERHADAVGTALRILDEAGYQIISQTSTEPTDHGVEFQLSIRAPTHSRWFGPQSHGVRKAAIDAPEYGMGGRRIEEDDHDVATDGGHSAEEYREKIAGKWDRDDPPALLFAGDAAPVIFEIDGHLWMLSKRLVYRRLIDMADLQAALDHRGPPDIVRLSELSHRFNREDFEADRPVDDAEQRCQIDLETGDEWDPEPAQLRDGENVDETSHTRRNIEQLRVLDGCDGSDE